MPRAAARVPAAECALPRTDMIVDADVRSQHLAAPAVMVAGDPEDWDAAFAEIGQSGEYAVAGPRDDGAPLEPEVEEVAVDHEAAVRDSPKELAEGFFAPVPRRSNA